VRRGRATLLIIRASEVVPHVLGQFHIRLGKSGNKRLRSSSADADEVLVYYCRKVKERKLTC
jgi:hypothetical protein